MNAKLCLKFFFIPFFVFQTAKASTGSWALQQIETAKAQELVEDSAEPVTVAVIDTGADLHHPDLRSALWRNPGESGKDSHGRDRASNGIDDDGNGYIDDIHGWNFVSNSPDLRDTHGHGTHIAGIIASQSRVGKNRRPQAHLMILKYYDAKQSNEKNLRNSIRAFEYALQMKVRLINYSGGGPGSHPDEEKIIRRAWAEKILLLAAAGNDGKDTDHLRYFPAAYSLPNILSVTALTANQRLPSYANFGRITVDLAAPGDQIISSLPGGFRGEMSGTSQATAFATAVAVLLLAQNPLLAEPEVLKQRLIASGTFEKSLKGKTVQNSRLNAVRALSMRPIQESAAGFVFDMTSEAESELTTLATSSLDQPPPLRHFEALSRSWKN